MEVIDLLENENKEYWINKLGECDWDAGVMLHRIVVNGEFFDTVGEGSKVLMLTDGGELVSFCTYSKVDDILPTELTPWMGFVFTFPKFRGHRYVGKLFEKVILLAKEDNYEKIYISTNHTGLYEKYGCEFLKNDIDDSGKPTRVYVKKVND